jgi:hypothetical protein
MAKQEHRDRTEDEAIDRAGERGGDTGPSSYEADGPQAEKGDLRRDKPVHSGPTRRGTSRHTSKHDKRAGSDSNAS